MNQTEHTATPLSVLQQLRSLLPAWALTHVEALQRIELQATRLTRLHGVTSAPVPDEIVTEALRIRIVHKWNLPVSGSAHWDGTD